MARISPKWTRASRDCVRSAGSRSGRRVIPSRIRGCSATRNGRPPGFAGAGPDGDERHARPSAIGDIVPGRTGPKICRGARSSRRGRPQGRSQPVTGPTLPPAQGSVTPHPVSKFTGPPVAAASLPRSPNPEGQDGTAAFRFACPQRAHAKLASVCQERPSSAPHSAQLRLVRAGLTAVTHSASSSSICRRPPRPVSRMTWSRPAFRRTPEPGRPAPVTVQQYASQCQKDCNHSDLVPAGRKSAGETGYRNSPLPLAERALLALATRVRQQSHIN